MNKVFIRYGKEKQYFEPPSDWNILTFSVFHDHPGDMDPEKLTRNALSNPVGTSPLRELISPADTVAILIEDQTRYSPKKAVLRALLKELEDAQIARDNISVIIALGTHRKLSSKEMEEVYGEDVVKKYAFFNHDCYSSDLVTIGKLRTGTPVKINRKVYEASYKIGIGSIFPHPLNGFGGGGKILFPGVSNYDAILEHHLRYSFRGGSELGNLEGNPFYEEVCAQSKAAGLDFIINSVLDHNDRLFDLTCGDPVEAHLAGIKTCKDIISKQFQKRADITVISSFPYTEGMQLMKPLAPATIITKKGGIIILVAHCTFPFPDIYVKGCESFRIEHGDYIKESVLNNFENNLPIIDNGPPELSMSLAQALFAQDEFKVILVSKDIPRETVERLGFIFAEDLDQAFAMTDKIKPNPEVHIVPSGGVILPVLQDERTA